VPEITAAFPVDWMMPVPVAFVIVPLLEMLPLTVSVLPPSDKVPPVLTVKLATLVFPVRVTVLGEAMMALSAAPGMVAAGDPVQFHVVAEFQLPVALLVQVAAIAAPSQKSANSINMQTNTMFRNRWDANCPIKPQLAFFMSQS
jgi:hypothetical protein